MRIVGISVTYMGTVEQLQIGHRRLVRLISYSIRIFDCESSWGTAPHPSMLLVNSMFCRSRGVKP